MPYCLTSSTNPTGTGHGQEKGLRFLHIKDLEEHRSAVKATLERTGFDVGCIEKYPAFDQRPKDKCLADVAECDHYVLILAWRYGFPPEDDNPKKLSITHLEYEEAVRLKKPCLAFLLDPEHAWPPGRVDPNALSSRSKIGKFSHTVETARGRRFFTTPDSLAAAVLEPLREDVRPNNIKPIVMGGGNHWP